MRVKKLYPFPMFRKFYDREKAWKFVRNHKYKGSSFTINNYGDLSNCFVDMMYVIDGDCVRYTLLRHNIGVLHFMFPPPNLCNTDVLTTFVLEVGGLDNNSIAAHAYCIREGLLYLGPLLDVNLVVPDYSVYYAITNYSGSNVLYRDIQTEIKQRLGAVAYTVRR